jgi:rhodanese-related sulfurtransferase
MTRTLSEMMAGARGVVGQISPEDAAVALNNGQFDLVVDVREPAEYRELHVSGASCIPRGLLER